MFDIIKKMIKHIVKDKIKVSINGIKCDNPKCDFEDMSIKIEDYAGWLNKPCPKCGFNLLTDADFETVKKIIQIFPLTDKVKGPHAISLKMNGSGKFEFGKIRKIKK